MNSGSDIVIDKELNNRKKCWKNILSYIKRHYRMVRFDVIN